MQPRFEIRRTLEVGLQNATARHAGQREGSQCATFEIMRDEKPPAFLLAKVKRLDLSRFHALALEFAIMKHRLQLMLRMCAWIS